MTTPTMSLQECIDHWQREVDRVNADTRDRTRDGIASSTLWWLQRCAKADAPTPVNEFAPDYVSPPSDTLREIMEDRGWGATDLAAAMGVPDAVIDGLMQDRYRYGSDLSTRLATATGVSASFWRRRWEQWREAQQRNATGAA